MVRPTVGSIFLYFGKSGYWSTENLFVFRHGWFCIIWYSYKIVLTCFFIFWGCVLVWGSPIFHCSYMVRYKPKFTTQVYFVLKRHFGSFASCILCTWLEPYSQCHLYFEQSAIRVLSVLLKCYLNPNCIFISNISFIHSNKI